MMLGDIMYQADFNPFSECFRFFSSFACGGPWSGRHFYTRKERIEALERTKKRLQDEIAAIDEMIADLGAANLGKPERGLLTIGGILNAECIGVS